MPSRRCPHCKAVSTYDTLTTLLAGTNIGTLNLGKSSGLNIRFDRCRNEDCNGSVAVIFDDEGKEIEVHPGLEEEPDELLPPDVTIAFRQALKSRNEGIWDGCVLMCRRALEEATRILGEEIEPEDERAKYSKKVLYKRIEHLATEHRITPELRNWAHEARLGGKLGAHGGTEKQWNTRLDAEEIVEFASWFFRYVFVLPQQLAERKERVNTEDTGEEDDNVRQFDEG